MEHNFKAHPLTQTKPQELIVLSLREELYLIEVIANGNCPGNCAWVLGLFWLY